MKYLICSFCLGLLASCQSLQREKPGLADEKLARIMADLSIAEAATIGLSGYPKDSLMKVYFAQVFEIHGITPEQYEKDLRIIAEDLPHLESIAEASIKLLGGDTSDAKKEK